MHPLVNYFFITGIRVLDLVDVFLSTSSLSSSVALLSDTLESARTGLGRGGMIRLEIFGNKFQRNGQSLRPFLANDT